MTTEQDSGLKRGCALAMFLSVRALIELDGWTSTRALSGPLTISVVGWLVERTTAHWRPPETQTANRKPR